jgi:hypothetical protein
MKRRGRKSLFTLKLKKRICDLLANANTIKTACDACGIGERTYFNFAQKYPAFLAATREARARAKIYLVGIVRKAAKTNAKHAEWILERSWPSEYARVERIEQVDEKADENKMVVNIFYDTGNQSLAQLLDFPNAETDSPKVGREKQRRLLGQTTEKAPLQETMSDAPPPQ